jgi:hypothetical protein
MSVDGGQIFRAAWIAGVHKYYPGEPKAGYVAPWEETPEWERAAAASVFELVRAFIETTGDGVKKLSRENKGRYVALCWTAQIFKHIADPKPAYVADWEDLPQWQRETDSDIFERIEDALSSS